LVDFPHFGILYQEKSGNPDLERKTVYIRKAELAIKRKKNAPETGREKRI
jgi:hypothetical protein